MRGNLDPPCNAVGYIDRQVLGINHMYPRPAWKRSKVIVSSQNFISPLLLFFVIFHLHYHWIKFICNTFDGSLFCRLALKILHMRDLLRMMLRHGVGLLLNLKEFFGRIHIIDSLRPIRLEITSLFLQVLCARVALKGSPIRTKIQSLSMDFYLLD